MSRSRVLKISSAFARKKFYNSPAISNILYPAQQKSIRNTRKLVLPCKVIKSEMPEGILYESEAGAWMLVSDDAVVLKLPYPISTNMMWRAARSKTNPNKETNILSVAARAYKRKVRELYEPLFKALNWKCLDWLADCRIQIQPEKKRFTFSNVTHPRYDIDNYSKPLLDALKTLLFTDDRVFISQQLRLAEPVDGGLVWLSCIKAKEADWMHEKVSSAWLIGGDLNGNAA